MGSPRKGERWLRWGCIVFTIAAGSAISAYLDLGRLWTALKEIGPGFFLTGMGIYGVVLLASAVRLHLVFQAVGVAVSPLASARSCLAGHFLYFALFGALGGDTARSAFYAKRYGFGLPRVLATAPLDRLLGAIGFVLFALLTFVIGLLANETARPETLNRWWVIGGVAFLTAIMVLAVWGRRQTRFPFLKVFFDAFFDGVRTLWRDPVSATILQRVPLPPEPGAEPAPDAVSTHILQPDKEGQVSYTGLVFSPDGTRLYLANVNGSIKVFSVEPGPTVKPLRSFVLPPADAPRRTNEIPAGLAVSKDGSRLYIALNLSNCLGEMDTATGKMLRTWDVGVAPYDVRIVGNRAFVSNWGGRRPAPGDLTGPAGRGTLVRVDPIRHIASEGSVSIIDLTENRVLREVITGLHASGLEVSPNGRYVVVANAGSDTLSVIDSRTLQIVETIWTRQNPADLFGASPNALVFDRSGKNLYVCNGTHNAVAVVGFSPRRSKLKGLVPVGWFPGAIVHDQSRGSLYVANIKGVSPGRPRKSDGRPEFNSHQYHGSVSLVPEPNRRQLSAYTRQALANMRYPLLKQSAQKPRSNRLPQPVPERVGEPSVFKHVVYIIKENRTYDQVFGAFSQGNGDPELCIFGEEVTPNQHKIVKEFVLLDNTYCSGILSADGHQWSTTAFATDYMEKSFAGFPRSYPDGMEDDDVDALAYSPAGFIWDNAVANGKTLRDYGEFAITRKSWRDKSRKAPIKFADHYREFLQGTDNIVLYSEPAVESLRPYLNTNTVGWDMDVPDVFRAAQFIKELKQYEQKGEFPNLVIICLPNDHTSGTSVGAPTPAAQVADNDLAFGQIVEAISHSKFWKETCILAIEDDPQAGWDHVSGYRTTAYVVSPYTKRGKIISTQYNQTSIIRTMELILGLPPMNQLDATATPMFDCFQNEADLTPFVSVKNRIPLDQMNPDPKAISEPLLRKHAYASARLPLDKPDQCSEDLLNRILWHAMKGPHTPYPVWAVHTGLEDDDD